MTDRDDLSALFSDTGDETGLDAFEQDLIDKFAQAEPASDAQFTMDVISAIGHTHSKWRIWSMLIAALVSLVLMSSQLSGLNESLSGVLQPMLSQASAYGPESLAGVLIAGLVLGVAAFVPDLRPR